MSNPNDHVRDEILRHLYAIHRNARGPKAVATKIGDLQGAMKQKGIAQKDVNANLDYLIQKGWVREVRSERTFRTPQGTAYTNPDISYKISDVGIDKLEGASAYRREEHFSRINVVTVQGVTIIGDGNVVNSKLTDLYREVAELEKAVSESNNLSNEEKLNVVADLGGIQSQLAKPKPDREVIRRLWSGIEKVVTVSHFGELVTRVAALIASFLGSPVATS